MSKPNVWWSYCLSGVLDRRAAAAMDMVVEVRAGSAFEVVVVNNNTRADDGWTRYWIPQLTHTYLPHPTNHITRWRWTMAMTKQSLIMLSPAFQSNSITCFHLLCAARSLSRGRYWYFHHLHFDSIDRCKHSQYCPTPTAVCHHNNSLFQSWRLHLLLFPL